MLNNNNNGDLYGFLFRFLPQCNFYYGNEVILMWELGKNGKTMLDLVGVAEGQKLHCVLWEENFISTQVKNFEASCSRFELFGNFLGN
jgi:hypothetical protein